ncbi:uncharacterized protein LOC135344466 [Halichondria panicea]|uniref:uncharacterized protein LOC135344466 n=1 Tax=Halichondria panicea TaxID=6063 RepID=UPI00312B446B
MQAKAKGMATVINSFSYSKGRGRGLLALSESLVPRKPGTQSSASSEPPSKKEDPTKLLIAMHKYTADPNSPGGFPEMSLEKGQLLVLCGEHPDNEHWWKVRNEDMETGYVPASYVIIKEECLPWLQLSSLKSEEEERKERVKRLSLEKSASQGIGFGPAPKAQAYVSAYSRSSSDRHYCEVCDKRLNGPKPYSAHMASRAHKEEVESRKLYG